MYYPFYINPETGSVALKKSDEHFVETYPIKSNGVDGRWRWGKETASLRLSLLVGKTVQGTNRYNIYEKDYIEQSGALKRIKPKSIMAGSQYSTDSATKKYRAIMEGIDFTNPKSVELISDLIEYCCPPNNNSIVLDFFSGSATTAHALFELNNRDRGNRKFITIQLPEITNEKSEAYKEGYFNICEIGKERIRRAGKVIFKELLAAGKELREEQLKVDEQFANAKGDLGMSDDPKLLAFEERKAEIQNEIDQLQYTLEHLDLGFRVYRLDSSNMQDVYYRPQDYEQVQLDLFADNVKGDRTPDDLLAQVMLDLGLMLSYPIEQSEITGKSVYKVQGNSLWACFETGIDEAFARAIAKEKPLRVVFRDSGFKDDTAKINVQQLLKQLSPETEMKVI